MLLQFACQKEAGGAEELQARDPDPACSHVAVHEVDGQVEGLISQIQILLGRARSRSKGELTPPTSGSNKSGHPKPRTYMHLYQPVHQKGSHLHCHRPRQVKALERIRRLLPL